VLSAVGGPPSVGLLYSVYCLLSSSFNFRILERTFSATCGEVGGWRSEVGGKKVLPQTSSEAILKPQTAGQILVAAKGLHWAL
jgi:hypothetical protein